MKVIEKQLIEKKIKNINEHITRVLVNKYGTNKHPYKYKSYLQVLNNEDKILSYVFWSQSKENLTFQIDKWFIDKERGYNQFIYMSSELYKQNMDNSSKASKASKASKTYSHCILNAIENGIRFKTKQMGKDTIYNCFKLLLNKKYFFTKHSSFIKKFDFPNSSITIRKIDWIIFSITKVG